MNRDFEEFEWTAHLEELRRRLFVILAALAAASLVAFFFSDPIFHALTRPIRVFEEKLYFLSPYEAFLVKLKVSLFAGVVLSSPVIFAQIWLFVAPGLYEREKKLVLLSACWTALCFAAGIVFAYFLVAPFALKFFLGFQTPDLRPLISIREYISFLTALLISFGAAFVFPVFLLLLVQLGILEASTLARQRRLAVVVIFVASAMLTPSTDILSQLLLAVPLILLFEGSLFFARRIERRKAAGSGRP
ncbi:MAG: twin-arginine translocase subunit TatC [Candidatus Omnitrophica bacterium]|nr:twin-arginine translocase subunit TatC [Candidatus Omnitrophota bacterium]